MSDIGLRLDGLILVCAILLSGIIYALATGTALLTAWLSVERRPPALRVARRGGMFTLLCVIVGVVAGAYLDRASTPIDGPDVIDWLTVPWLLLFVGGCIALVQVRRDDSVSRR